MATGCFWEAPVHSVRQLAQQLVDYASEAKGQEEAITPTACVGLESPHTAQPDEASTHKKLLGLCVEFLDLPAADVEAIEDFVEYGVTAENLRSAVTHSAPLNDRTGAFTDFTTSTLKPTNRVSARDARASAAIYARTVLNNRDSGFPITDEHVASVLRRWRSRQTPDMG